MSLFWMKNHRCGLGPMETGYSDANRFVWHAQSERCGLGPIETSNSGDNHAVFHAQNDS